MRGMQRYILDLELKTPVHVGMGADHNYPAYAYLPDFEKKEVVLLDSARLVKELDPARREVFLQAVAAGPARAQQLLRDWYNEGVPLPEEGRLPASPAFLNTVKEASEQAELEFRPLPRSVEGPYLPGSSVKGALRTAWIYERLIPKLEQADLVYRKRAGWQEQPRNGEGYIKPGRGGLYAAQALEALALGNLRGGRPEMHKDPFRAVRLGDSPALTATRLERIGVVHPSSRLKDVAILAEVIPAGTRIRIPFRYHKGLAEGEVVSGSVDPEDLINSVFNFYQGVLEEEESYATSLGWERAVKFYRELSDAFEADTTRFPLRFGFGSGRVSNTLLLLMEDELPKTRKSAGRSDPVLGLPMGWAAAELIKD